MAYLRTTLAAMAAASSLSLGATGASASAFCDAQVASYRGELETKVAPVAAEIDQGIADIRKGGGDPDKIGLKMHDGTFKTLPELRSLVLSQKAEALKEIDDAAGKCAQSLKPYQDVTDASVIIATGGLSLLLPKRMTHIEIGEILAGKPLGGDGGLVPHFREQMFGLVGLQNDRGEVTKFIRDPVRTTIEAPVKLVKQWFPHL
ncbi:hypothetical protein ACVWWO_005622 [Bradyrhizobium sp. F1.13.1]